MLRHKFAKTGSALYCCFVIVSLIKAHDGRIESTDHHVEDRDDENTGQADVVDGQRRVSIMLQVQSAVAQEIQRHGQNGHENLRHKGHFLTLQHFRGSIEVMGA